MPFFLISTVHAWNARLVPVFGFPLNFLLFWLVWTKTPKEMRVHSRILLQTCIVDLAFLSVSLVVTPVLIYHNSISLVLLDGYMMRIFASIMNYNPISVNIINLISNVCFLFDIFSISVQFAYRYFVLNRNTKISLAHYLLMLTVPFVVSLIIGLFYAVNFTESTELTGELRASLNDYVDWENSIYIIGKGNQYLWALSCFLAESIFYSSNIFFGIKVIKFVSGYAALNSRLKALNQQLTKTLIILALSPLLVFIFGLAIFALILAINFNGTEILEKIILLVEPFCYLCGEWLPVANPIISIWINRPYRDVIKKFMARLFKKNNQITITTVLPLNQ